MTSFNAAKFPVAKRNVPRDIIVHLILSGRFFQWGIIPFFVGIALVYCCRPVIVSVVALRSHTKTTVGKVYFSQDTGVTKNSLPIYMNKYSYTTPDGVSRHGVSYGKPEDATGQKPVLIVYSQSDPNLSVISGMRSTDGSVTFAVFSLIPLFGGLGLIVFSLYESYKLYYLLEQGYEGSASLADKIQTKKMVNLHPVYHYMYSFKTPSGQIKRLTHDTFEWLNDSQLVVYSEKWDELTALVVGLPGKVILANGEITSHSSWSQATIVPCIGIALAMAIVVIWK